MRRKNPESPMAKKFVSTMIEMIEERNGTYPVNLREVAKRIGCSHTNVYNHFDGFDGLILSTLAQVIAMMNNHINTQISDEKTAIENYKAWIDGYIDFAINHVGLYRFLTADPTDTSQIPSSILMPLVTLREQQLQIAYSIIGARLANKETDDICDTVTTYLEGSLANYINGRILEAQEITPETISHNCMHLFYKLSLYDEEALLQHIKELQ